MAIYTIKLEREVKQEELQAVASQIDALEDKPSGTYELIWEFARTGKAVSYCNDRVLWLGWQMEKNGVAVNWSKSS